MSDSDFGQQIRSAATPSDRKSGVDRRARRHRPLVVLTGAAVTGLTLVAVAALARPELGAGEPSQTVGDAASPSATATDGVLRTAGCATFPLAGPTEIDGSPVSPNSELLNELNIRIQPDAITNFAELFAGVEFTDIGRLGLPHALIRLRRVDHLGLCPGLCRGGRRKGLGCRDGDMVNNDRQCSTTGGAAASRC